MVPDDASPEVVLLGNAWQWSGKCPQPGVANDGNMWVVAGNDLPQLNLSLPQQHNLIAACNSQPFRIHHPQKQKPLKSFLNMLRANDIPLRVFTSFILNVD